MPGVKVRKHGGVNIADMHRWGGQVVITSRVSLAEAEKLPALQRPGIYIFHNREPRVYIREANDVSEIKADIDQKDFWTDMTVITTKPVVGPHRFRGLAEQWEYLRAILVGLAKATKQAKLNNTADDMQIPPISDDLILEAELFLAGALMCLRAVGINFFQKGD